MPSALAVAAVASLITALAVWQGQEPDQPRAAASTASTQAGSPSASSAAATASDSPTADAQSSAPEATASTAGTGVAGTKTREPVDRSSFEVVVLNQTARGGLAGSVAEELRGAGWDVPAVGNFRGTVPATTVYYPAGGERAALAVARDLSAEPRTGPRFGNLSTTRLTVVVTDTYPG